MKKWHFDIEIYVKKEYENLEFEREKYEVSIEKSKIKTE